VLARLDRPDRRLLHVLGRREVGLADAEADDVAALARERVHLGEHDEGVLGSQARRPAADLRHKWGHEKGSEQFFNDRLYPR
jgi:hypothetical protein